MKTDKILKAFVRYHTFFFTGKVEIIISKTGVPESTGRPFLEVRIKNQPSPGTCLVVSFEVDRLSWLDRWFIPFVSIPFFAGAPGFIAKSFLLDAEKRTFRGTYEWVNDLSAQTYLDSYASGFMRRISKPGSLTYKITPIQPA